MDAASPDWQRFIIRLARELYEKDVDGFFIDNCDVYYYAPRKDIFDGLTVILQYIMTLGKEVIINGGDTYVTEYKERYGTIDPIMTGVNQETVWSHIDFVREPLTSRTGRRGSISADIWNHVRQMEWKCICWNIQPTGS